MNARALLYRAYWLLSDQFGIDPRKFLRAFVALPRFVRDYARFRARYSGPLELLPCLHDRTVASDPVKQEYFWQDLLVARMIFDAHPERHVDVGSRLDGFVAHVASFREIEVFDLRPLAAAIPGVIYTQADLTGAAPPPSAYCDSLSCLHALEHFGLGRYGDAADPEGFERGFANLARLLRPGGRLYLSLPLGVARVEFNGQRVLDPRAVIDLARRNALAAQTLTLIRAGGRLDPCELRPPALSAIAAERYVLGLFTLHKLA